MTLDDDDAKLIEPIATSFQVGVLNPYLSPSSLLVKEFLKESISFPPLASFHQAYKRLLGTQATFLPYSFSICH